MLRLDSFITLFPLLGIRAAPSSAPRSPPCRIRTQKAPGLATRRRIPATSWSFKEVVGSASREKACVSRGRAGSESHRALHAWHQDSNEAMRRRAGWLGSPAKCVPAQHFLPSPNHIVPPPPLPGSRVLLWHQSRLDIGRQRSVAEFPSAPNGTLPDSGHRGVAGNPTWRPHRQPRCRVCDGQADPGRLLPIGWANCIDLPSPLSPCG